MHRTCRISTLFPYTTLFRSLVGFVSSGSYSYPCVRAEPEHYMIAYQRAMEEWGLLAPPNLPLSPAYEVFRRGRFQSPSSPPTRRQARSCSGETAHRSGPGTSAHDSEPARFSVVNFEGELEPEAL